MLKVIKKRRSIRTYQKKEIEEEKLQEILKAAMFAPSARHSRPWEFIIIKDKKTKDKLAATKDGSGFANEAPLVIVILAQETYQWIEDCSIVAENIYLETTNLGLGTCWVQIRGSERPDGSSCEEYVKTILNIPEGIRVLCLMPLGYPAEEKEEHQEEEFEKEKIHLGKY